MAEEQVTTQTQRPALYIGDGQRTLLSSIMTGVAVGVVGWLASLAVSAWLIEPLFCRTPETFAVCANGGTIGWGIAMIVVSIGGLFGLIRAGVYRPLLVVLATLISLWGVSLWLGPLEWWHALLWHGALFGLAYGVFAWIARVSLFLVALIATIVVIVLLRLLVINS